MALNLLDILGTAAASEIESRKKREEESQKIALADLLSGSFGGKAEELKKLSPEIQKTFLEPFAKKMFEKTPQSYTGKLPKAPKGKVWVDTPTYDQQANTWYTKPTLESEKPEKSEISETGKFSMGQQLRSQFLNQSKDYQTIRDSYSRILESVKEPSAAGDMSIIFNYMKMLDPNSVVRESEYATAANAAGVPERVRSLYNKTLTGEKLGENQRQDFVGTSNKLYEAQLRQHQKRVKEYSILSSKRGIDPSEVTLDITPPISPKIMEKTLTATNPKTGQKAISNDGGKTWQIQ